MSQTFLPYEDYAVSAGVLDRLRLGKQRVENLTIMRSLCGVTATGQNHPIALAWRTYEPALMEYQMAICAEWTSRGYRDTCLEKTWSAYYHGLASADHEMLMFERPPWIGQPEFHEGYRAHLIRKDPEFYGPIFLDHTNPNAQLVWPGLKVSA